MPEQMPRADARRLHELIACQSATAVASSESVTFATPRTRPAVAILPPPTLCGNSRAALRPSTPAIIAGMPVNGPKHSKIPHTNATTAAVLAGGFSPRGRPVVGSMVMACIAIVAAEPVIGFPGGLAGGP